VSWQLHKSCGDPAQDVETMKAEGFQWIIVDTGPAMMPHIERAVEAADFVLIPAEASMFRDRTPARMRDPVGQGRQATEG
jgi:ribose 1,5-bisphosphokinase PhnN